MSCYTLNDLYHFLLLHGYDTNIKKFSLDDNILACMKDLAELDLTPFQGKEIPTISKFEMTHNAKRFMRENFSLHRVGYLSDKRLAKILHDERIQTIDDVAVIYNQSARLVDPFHVPIRYDLDSIFGGTLVVQNVVTEDTSFFEQLLPRLNLYFTHISLPKTITTITPMSYVHEITHSQLESYKGIISNYYNGELLSVFMEFLYSYETNKDVFEIDLSNRIENLLYCFYSMYLYQVGKENPDREYNEYEYFYDSQYFISILKAFQLFHLYDSSNDSIKRYILEGIQKVFDGKILLEDFLDSLDIHTVGAINSEYAKYFVKKKS